MGETVPNTSTPFPKNPTRTFLKFLLEIWNVLEIDMSDTVLLFEAVQS